MPPKSSRSELPTPLARRVFHSSGRPLPLSVLVSIAIQGLNAVTGVLLARALGPSGRGELTAAFLWPWILALVVSFGVMEAATYRTAKAPEAAGVVLGTSLVIAAGQSLIAIAVGAGLIPLVLSGHDSSVVWAGLAFLSHIPFYLAGAYAGYVLNGIDEFRVFQAYRFGLTAVAAVGIVALAAVGSLSVTLAIAAYVFAHAVVAVATVWAALVRIGRPSVDRAVGRELLSFGVKSHSSTVPTLLNQRLDQLVVSVVLSSTSLGLYAVAVTLSSLTSAVGASVLLVALPAVARGRSDPQRLEISRRYVSGALLISTVVTAPLVVFAPQLIELFFGSDFRSAGDVSRIVLVATVALATGRALNAALKGVNRPLDAGIAELGALGITVIALAALLPAFGLIGAGLASLLAYTASTVWMARKLRRALGARRTVDLFIPERSLLSLRRTGSGQQ
jgi:O-antigen/teichoic acid export membrane protein